MSAPIVSGTQAYTGNMLGLFNTEGESPFPASTNPGPWHLMNGTISAANVGSFARAPFGGYFQGLIIHVEANNHLVGNHRVTFTKITESSNYATKTDITALQIDILPQQTGFFWSNPDVTRGLRFFRAQDEIGIEVRKLSGSSVTGISGITVTAVYDFEEGI